MQPKGRLVLFPNPVVQELSVRFELQDAAEVFVEIFDMVGTRVYRNVNGKSDRGAQHVRMGTRGLAPGVYVVKVNVVRDGIVHQLQERVVKMAVK